MGSKSRTIHHVLWDANLLAVERTIPATGVRDILAILSPILGYCSAH